MLTLMLPSNCESQLTKIVPPSALRAPLPTHAFLPASEVPPAMSVWKKSTVEPQPDCGDRAGIEEAAVEVAGHVLENDRAAILGCDLAAILVGHTGHGVENDLAAVLGEEAPAVIGDADVGPFQPDRAAAAGRVELALVGHGKRVAGEAFEKDAAVVAGFDQGADAVVKAATNKGDELQSPSP